MKIVLPDKINIPDTYKDEMRNLGAELYEDLPDEAELKHRIADAEVITANYVDITPEVIDAAPKLKYIIVPAVGYEWVDVDYAASKGITTLNCPTFNSQAVAEHAMSLLMAVNRNLGRGMDELRAGKWHPQAFVGYELAGKHLGLVGYGNIGTRIEQLATVLGMHVSYVNSRSTADEIDELMRSADFVVICAPLTEATHHLIDERRLRLMKPTAVLVNVGRGAIVDQGALMEVLKAGHIRGGLDVFDGEPLTGTPNETLVELASLPNVIATPHIAYNTVEMQDKQGAELLGNIKSCIEGAPIHVVRRADTRTIPT